MPVRVLSFPKRPKPNYEYLNDSPISNLLGMDVNSVNPQQSPVEAIASDGAPPTQAGGGFQVPSGNGVSDEDPYWLGISSTDDSVSVPPLDEKFRKRYPEVADAVLKYLSKVSEFQNTKIDPVKADVKPVVSKMPPYTFSESAPEYDNSFAKKRIRDANILAILGVIAGGGDAMTNSAIGALYGGAVDAYGKQPDQDYQRRTIAYNNREKQYDRNYQGQVKGAELDVESQKANNEAALKTASDANRIKIAQLAAKRASISSEGRSLQGIVGKGYDAIKAQEDADARQKKQEEIDAAAAKRQGEDNKAKDERQKKALEAKAAEKQKDRQLTLWVTKMKDATNRFRINTQKTTSERNTDVRTDMLGKNSIRATNAKLEVSYNQLNQSAKALGMKLDRQSWESLVENRRKYTVTSVGISNQIQRWVQIAKQEGGLTPEMQTHIDELKKTKSECEAQISSIASKMSDFKQIGNTFTWESPQFTSSPEDLQLSASVHDPNIRKKNVPVNPTGKPDVNAPKPNIKRYFLRGKEISPAQANALRVLGTQGIVEQ